MLTGPSPLFTVCSPPSPWQALPPALSPSVCRGACPPPPDPQTLPGPGLVSYPFTLSTMNCSRHIGKTLAVTVRAGTRAMGREEERWERWEMASSLTAPAASETILVDRHKTSCSFYTVHSTAVVFTHSSCCPYPLSIPLPPRQISLTPLAQGSLALIKLNRLPRNSPDPIPIPSHPQSCDGLQEITTDRRPGLVFKPIHARVLDTALRH